MSHISGDKTLSELEEKAGSVDEDRPTNLGDQARRVLQKYPWLEWLIPAALCAVMLGQLLLSAQQLSQTSDEATHLYSGYRALTCGDFTVSPEHPPLAKVIAAAPLFALNFTVDCAPFQGTSVQQALDSANWLYRQNWPAALARPRMAVSVFAVGLCLLVWIAARQMFDLPTAIVAILLLTFEPNVLAYGPLVMNDVPITCMLLFTIFGFYLWVRHRTARFLLLTALATGLTLLTKNSGVLVIPILCALAITDGLTQPSADRWDLVLRNLLAVALICVLATGIVWAGYGMLLAAHPAAFSQEHHLLPRAYLQGFATAVALSHQGGSVAFVAGKIYLHAPWFSALFNFLIRSTAALLAMILAAAFGLAISFRRGRRELLFLLVPGAVYLAVSIHANINVGVRYLLPMFPFLLIAVAAGCVMLARRARWMTYTMVALIALHAASSLHAFPNYLSYANDLWGGPARAYKYQPWLDLGQAYPEAKTYLEQHPAKDCWLITGWHWDPALYGVPCHSFGLYLPHEIPPRVHGTFLVSSTLLTDVRLAEGEIAAPFRYATPKGHIGGSALLVYEGDFDTSLDAAAGERNLSEHEGSAGRVSVAFEHGRRAVELAPSSALAHANLCNLLAPIQVDSALKECYIARSLLLQDPLRDEQGRKYYLDSLEKTLRMLRR